MSRRFDPSKDRALYESGLVAFNEETGGTDRVNMDLSRRYETFRDILVDWQAELGIDFSDPRNMLEVLGLQNVITPQEYSDMLFGNAVPSTNMTDYLSRVYQQTMVDIPDHEKASRVVFERKAAAALQKAEAGKPNDLGQVPRVLTLPDAVMKSQLSRQQYEVPPESEARSPNDAPDYSLVSAEATAGSDFYTFLREKIALRAQARKHTFEEELAAFAAHRKVHPWQLQGFMPLPQERHDEIIRSIADTFFEDMDTYEAEQPKHEFYRQAEQFFKRNTSLDIITGQNAGFRQSFGGLLDLAMQHHGMSDQALGNRMRQRGFEVTPEQVARWRSQSSLPNPDQLECLSAVLHFNGMQRQEFRRSYDIAQAGKRISYALEKEARTPAEGPAAEPGPVLAEVVQKSPVSTDELAFYLGIYPSLLKAYGNGELIPPTRIIDKAVRLFSLSSKAKQHLHHRADARHVLLKKTATPAQLYQHDVLVGTDNATVTLDFLNTAFNEESPFGTLPDLLGASTARKLNRGYQQNVEPGTLVKIANRMGVPQDSARFSILQDIRRHGAGKPFGLMLEQYKASGGNDLSEFLTRFMTENRFSSTDVARYSGGHPDTIPLFVRASRIKFDYVIEGFVNGFHCDRAQAAYFWQLAKGELPTEPYRQGDESLPAPPKTARDIVFGAKWRLEKGGNSREVANELAYNLMKYSGYGRKQLRQMGMSSPTLQNIAKRCADFENTHYPEIYERFVNAVLPDDPALARMATNLLFGITRERTPREFMDALRKGEMTMGAMLKQYRLQKRLSQKEFFEIVHPFLDPTGKRIKQGVYGNWEMGKGKSTLRERSMARRLARAVGMEAEEDIQDFAAIAMGRYVKERISDAQLLDALRKEEITWGGFITSYRRQHGLSQSELQQETGISAIANWENNNQPVMHRHLAERFADYIGYRDDDREDFIAQAMKKRGHDGPDEPETGESVGALGGATARLARRRSHAASRANGKTR